MLEELTRKQIMFLIDMVNASIKMASNSGIPIHEEYSKDIEAIKTILYEELRWKE